MHIALICGVLPMCFVCACFVLSSSANTARTPAVYQSAQVQLAYPRLSPYHPQVDDLRFLVGPKLYEANWLELVEQGYLANVQVTVHLNRPVCSPPPHHTVVVPVSTSPLRGLSTAVHRDTLPNVGGVLRALSAERVNPGSYHRTAVVEHLNQSLAPKPSLPWGDLQEQRQAAGGACGAEPEQDDDLCART